jgi:hypothetical protein
VLRSGTRLWPHWAFGKRSTAGRFRAVAADVAPRRSGLSHRPMLYEHRPRDAPGPEIGELRGQLHYNRSPLLWRCDAAVDSYARSRAASVSAIVSSSGPLIEFKERGVYDRRGSRCVAAFAAERGDYPALRDGASPIPREQRCSWD